MTLINILTGHSSVFEPFDYWVILHCFHNIRCCPFIIFQVGCCGDDETTYGIKELQYVQGDPKLKSKLESHILCPLSLVGIYLI